MPEVSLRHGLPTVDDIALPPAIEAQAMAAGVVLLRGHCPHGSTMVTLEPCVSGGQVERVNLMDPAVHERYTDRIRRDHHVRFGCNHLKGVRVA